MPKAVYTPEQKQQALEQYRLVGPAMAARVTGIKAGTIKSWAKRDGIRATSTLPERQDALAAQQVTMEQARLRLAEGMLADADRLRGQLFAPCRRVEVKVVAQGGDMGSDVEQVEVELDEPSFPDKLALVRSIAGLVEKVQLLTGEATSRQEVTGGYDLEAELQAYQQGLADREPVEA